MLLGHHQDDLFENFFIRMLRGSGLKGLVSLNKKTKLDNINLFRPLLDQKKDNLEFLSKYVFNFYVKDPTNNDEKYQRIKIRKLISKLKMNGLDQKKFYNTIENLKYSNSVIENYVDENIKRNTFFLKIENKLIINKDFFLQPKEVVFRALSNLIKKIGNKYYPVRGKKISQNN